MKRIQNARAHSIGLRSEERIELPSVNHFKTSSSLSKTAEAEIKARGLIRVAGNNFLCPSTRDFWAVEDGKIRRITVTEVDNGESIVGAPATDPSQFLDAILSDLSF